KIRIEGKTPDGDYAGYIDPDAPNEDLIWISDCLSPENKRMQYVYDFGDNWEHLITLEKIYRDNDDLEIPICIGGKRAVPPEDCGGCWGYMELLEDRKHSNNLDDSDEEEWLEEDFDPNSLTMCLPFIKEKEIKRDLGVPLFPLP
ncbi:MAG: plasmid pRiA4b ORF-3 family protein, partial [Promethearchaeota archaeon]